MWKWIGSVCLIHWLSGPLLVCHGWTEWENVVNTARCRVRCFASQQAVGSGGLVRGGGGNSKTTDVLQQCLENEACVECLKPCTQSYVNLPMCQRICDEAKQPSCLSSCDFLASIYTSHPGTCPRVSEVLLSARGCAEECATDTQCALDLKCCPTSCGTTCHPPVNPYRGMPPIPQQPTIREKARSGTIEIRWDLPDTTPAGNSEVILYIIEESYSVANEDTMSPWQQITQTTSTVRTLREIKPGHSYRFRVSAVNEYGSQGVSPPTEIYRLSREPNAPEPPRNLTEGDTIIKDGRIGVIVKWLPPKRSDLPVARYKVLWSRKLDDAEAEYLDDGEQRENVNGDSLQFEIPNLDPDTTYFVQVQALSLYGDAKLKSVKIGLFITTYPLPHQSVVGMQVDVQPLPTPKPIEALVIHTPFYHNGLLKVNVSWNFPPTEEGDMVRGSLPGEEFEPPPPHIERVMITWKPTVCFTDVIEEGMSQTLTANTERAWFLLFDLRFDCHYEVIVNSLSQSGITGPHVTLTFPTPSCHNVHIRGGLPPDCPTNAPRVPEPPIQLTNSFIINRGNITARLSWITPPSDTPLTGIRIQWGPMLLEFGPDEGGSEGPVFYSSQDDALTRRHPVIDRNHVYYKVLPKEETTYSITNLNEATKYVAKVQAMSKGGDGRPAVVTFNTPLVSLTPLHHLYNVVTEKELFFFDPYEGKNGHFNQPTPALMEEKHEFSSQGNSAIKSNCLSYLILVLVPYAAIKLTVYYLTRTVSMNTQCTRLR